MSSQFSSGWRKTDKLPNLAWKASEKPRNSAHMDIASSKLGTKKYWDDFYRLESSNFDSNPEDTGECWFDESDAETKVIDFLVENYDFLEKGKVVDLGTGNGKLLFDLCNEDQGLFSNWQLIGLDYSEVSVDFAKKIAHKLDLSSKISFDTVDFLGNHQEFLAKYSSLSVVLDKGTLDAIALNDALYEYQGKSYKGYELYSRIVEQSLTENGTLVITSCNFSDAELESIITENSKLRVWKKIEYPTFSFGGKKGSTICTLAFKFSF